MAENPGMVRAVQVKGIRCRAWKGWVGSRTAKGAATAMPGSQTMASGLKVAQAFWPVS